MPTPLINGMYNELLYHVDLCILAYHLYHQTLIWPMDPFYEHQAHKFTNRRTNFMNTMRSGPGTLGTPVPTTYKGPANFLNSRWATNTTLDPVITDYTRLNPWIPSFPKITQWEFIQPSKFITDKIATVYMCQNQPGEGAPGNPGEPAVIRRKDNPAGNHDSIYCFEGGTGGTGITPHAWSMMGFVLVRNWGEGGQYDVHIAFRGSRSGSAGRAAASGLWGSGNPDWVTDLAWNLNANLDRVISPIGRSSCGFTQSIKSILPGLMACFKAINREKGTPPRTIYVTGHSLGGALAALCASALVIGVPGEFPIDWPWNELHLITFSAPTVGDENFSNYVNSWVYARRVNLAKDPITTTKTGLITTKGGGHVGAVIELPPLPGWFKQLESHDYSIVREQLIKTFPPAEYHADQDTTITKRYSNFSELYNTQKTTMSAECLPDFDKHLIEYLNIFRCIIAQHDSYRMGQYPSDTEVRGRKIDTLITALSNNTVNATNVFATWTAAAWDKVEDVNIFLALCLVLSLFSKNVQIDGLPVILKGLLEKI